MRPASERGEHFGISVPFENLSERNNTLQVFKTKDETRNSIADELSELLVPGTNFDGQSHPHHMVTGPTAQTNQIPEFLTGRILAPRDLLSHQHQNLSTQVSQDNILPMTKQTPRNQNSESNNSFKTPAEAISGITTQQRPQAATMIRPLSTNAIIFHGKNKKIELFEDLFHTMPKL